MKAYTKRYIIIWGEGQSQKVETKTEAIKIASELLINYQSVTINKL